MRNERKANSKVLLMIAKMYERLSDISAKDRQIYYAGLSYEDIFQDTIIKVSTDEKAAEITDENEFVKYFIYRMRTVQYQTIKNSKRLKITTYADNLQAKESEKEGEETI